VLPSVWPRNSGTCGVKTGDLSKALYYAGQLDESFHLNNLTRTGENTFPLDGRLVPRDGYSPCQLTTKCTAVAPSRRRNQHTPLRDHERGLWSL
jgi:hypothetical protein